MRIWREVIRAASGLSACLAALWLISQPAPASETQAAKADKLVVTTAKGDLMTPKPDRPQPAAASQKDFALGGAAARRLVDVAVRADGMWLNSFATRSMPLEALDCAVLSDEIVSNLGLPGGAVERLAEEELMRQVRICGVNGSLLVTCYGGAATVSLRRPQPADGCGG